MSVFNHSLSFSFCYQSVNAVTATEETNLIVPTATGEAKPILNRTKTVITIEIDIMMTWDREIVGGHEDTTAVLGTDRVTEDTTMALGTDRVTAGTVGTMTDRGEETLDLLTAGGMIASESVTEEKDSAVDGITAIETGMEKGERRNHRHLYYRLKLY